MEDTVNTNDRKAAGHTARESRGHVLTREETREEFGKRFRIALLAVRRTLAGAQTKAFLGAPTGSR